MARVLSRFPATVTGEDGVTVETEGGALKVGVEFTPAGSDVKPFSIGTKLRQIVNLHDYGAIGDGVSNDAPALAKARSVLDDGGFIQTLPGRKYLFNGGLVLDRGHRLIGQTVPNKVKLSVPAPEQFASSVIVRVDEPIVVGDGAEFAGFAVFREGFTAPTSTASAEVALAGYAGTAIYSDSCDPIIRKNLIIGFAKAVVIDGADRPEVYGNAFDCNNGIDVSGVFDCGSHGISHNRGWPYLTAHMPWSDWYLARRPGTAIYVHDTADGMLVQRNFSYGYATGLHLDDVFGVRASHFADNVGGHDAAAAVGTVGIKTTGACNLVLIDGCHVDSHQDNYVFNHSGSLLQLGSNSSGGATRRHVTLKVASAGDLGRFEARGAGTDLIYAETGVSKWVGAVFSDATPSSGVGITYDPANIANVIDIVFRSPGDTITGPAGVLGAPTLAVSRKDQSGFYATSGDIVAVVKGKVSAFFRGVTNAVNWVTLRSSATGGPVDIYAEGSDAIVDIRFVAKGASGKLQTIAPGGLEIPGAAADPPVGTRLIYYNTVSGKYRVTKAGAWVDLL